MIAAKRIATYSLPISAITSRQPVQWTDWRFIEHRRGESEQTAKDVEPVRSLAIADDSSIGASYATTRRRRSKTTRSTCYRQTTTTACGCRCCWTAAAEPDERSVVSTCCCCRLRADNYVRRYVTAAASSSSYVYAHVSSRTFRPFCAKSMRRSPTSPLSLPYGPAEIECQRRQTLTASLENVSACELASVGHR